MDEVYGVRDRRRGVDRTFAWFVSEVGELGDALVKNRGCEHLKEEAADVLAWLLSFCNVAGVDLDDAFNSKYGSTCPRCGAKPCGCPTA